MWVTTGCANQPGSTAPTPQHLTALATMKVVLPSLPHLQCPHNSQSVFGVSERGTGNVHGGLDFIFDKFEDKIGEWVQDERHFINHNGLTCKFRPSNAMLR